MRTRHLVVGLLLQLEPGSSADQIRSPSHETTARPFVALEKSRFLVGEQIFFWVGVSAGAIPESLCDTGRVSLTRPDGTERVDRSGCPIDGPRGGGWKGGRSLGPETPQTGRWSVVFEFAGHRSEPATFTVEHDDIVRQIDAEFVLSSPLVLDSPEAFATLTVQNRTTEAIRFPQRNLNNLVSIRLTKTTDGPWGSDFFVPEPVLLEATGLPRALVSYPFTWEFADRVQTVSVAPGQSYQLRLPLAAALAGSTSRGLSRIPPGEYDIRLWTLLEALVGSQDGRWKDHSPLRLEVTGAAHGVRR